MEITTRQQLRSDLSDETKPQLDSSVSLPLIEAAYLHTYLYVAGGLGSGNHWCERQTNLEGTTKPKMNPMKELYWKQFGGGPDEALLKRMDPDSSPGGEESEAPKKRKAGAAK